MTVSTYSQPKNVVLLENIVKLLPFCHVIGLQGKHKKILCQVIDTCYKSCLFRQMLFFSNPAYTLTTCQASKRLGQQVSSSGVQTCVSGSHEVQYCQLRNNYALSYSNFTISVNLRNVPYVPSYIINYDRGFTLEQRGLTTKCQIQFLQTFTFDKLTSKD